MSRHAAPEQPRDVLGRFASFDARAAREDAMAALRAGVPLTVFDLPPDPDISREVLFSGAVVIYRPATASSVRVTTPAHRHAVSFTRLATETSSVTVSS